jgi:putative ABC transport system permease protein
MPPMPNTNSGYTAMIRIVPWEVAKAFTVGFFATLFAALIPARRAARLRIVDALRYN